jgi:hypothetical protein
LGYYFFSGSNAQQEAHRQLGKAEGKVRVSRRILQREELINRPMTSLERPRVRLMSWLERQRDSMQRSRVMPRRLLEI